MTNTKSNVLVLADYRKANSELTVDDVKEFLDAKRTEIRDLETDTFDLLRIKHTSKDVTFLCNRALKVEELLLNGINWLEDKIAETKGAEKGSYEAEIKQCETLIARNERTKKNLTDDLAACRHTENRRELDPVKIVGFVVGTPLTLVNLVKAFAPSRSDLALEAGLSGVGVGTVLAFHHQAGELLRRTFRAAKKTPQQIKKVGKAAHSSFIAATLTMSVVSSRPRESEGLKRPQEDHRPQIVYSAKM